MAKHYDKQFKLDAVQYYHDHRNLGLQGCATNLGISQQTLSRWQKELWIYRCAESACPVFWKSPVRKEEITVPDR